jgi:glycolate oxidase
MSHFNPVTPECIEKLTQILGPKGLTTDAEKLESYQTDEEGNPVWFRKPEVVVFPETTEQVAEIVKLANTYLIPITPRAGATNVCCQAIPVYGGIVLTMDRMNKILKIDPDNMYLVTQPGVRTIDLQKAAHEHGLLYAGDPCSADSCMIGGNIATNAGGNKAVKYGTTRHQIYSLKLVTPTGAIVTVGARLQKCSTGYCLEQLICGAEGTLGIVTEITLKLLPLAPYKFDLVAIFKEESAALALPNRIKKAGIDPTSVEFMDNKCVMLCSNFVKVTAPHGNEGCCYVIITVETFDEDELDKKMEIVSDICDELGAVDILQADDRIWSIRRCLAEACRDADKMFMTEDFVVPLDKIPDVMSMIPELEKKHNLYLITSAHIGDGNMHTLALNTKGQSPEQWLHTLDAFHHDLFPRIYALGGKISGEHGIGYKKKDEFKACTQPAEYELVCAIKHALDPNNIMNPGKIVDLEEV